MCVRQVVGRNVLGEKLGATSQQIEPLLESIRSEEALRQMADPSFAAIPGKEVAKDGVWKQTSKLNLGPIGSYDTTYDYKYVGKDDKNKELDKITVTTTLKYAPPGADTVGAGLPFKIKDAKLESKNATGTILFDAKAGRLDSSEMNLTLG